MLAIVNLLGTVAFALAGYLVGVRKKLDLLGIAVLATLTAVGGGILRDAMLVRRPLVFTTTGAFYANAPFLIAATVAVAFVLRVHRLGDGNLARLYTVSDSMGLVAFAMAGADAGVSSGTNLFGTMLLAFVTAVGGGLVRDALVNEVPSVLHEDVYGTIAVLLGLGIGALHQCGFDHRPLTPLLFAAGVGLRFVVLRYDIRLPRAR